MENHGDKNSYKFQDTSPLSKTASRPKKYDVFLSHHRSDKEQVEIIAARLKDEVGLNPFLDKWRLEPGESWNEEIETALNNSAACAVFVGPHGPAPWQNEQMRSALHERIDNHTLRVIPVLLERAGPLEEDLLPQFLQPLSWVDFRSGLESQEAFSHLVADRKSTRLNSSHLGTSYAVFCLKKKNETAPPPVRPIFLDYANDLGTVGMPADARPVMTVGADDELGQQRAYGSVGPLMNEAQQL